MDNLTHSLVGLTAAKAGLEKLSPTATLVCILTANAPDVDIVYLLTGDRWSFLAHHRGLTHSIIGTLTLALLIPLLFYLVDLLIATRTKRDPVIKLRGLLFGSVVVGATHPLLDWSNNYGIRLLLPWSSRWFYGDLVFIVDPVMWLIIGGTGFLSSSHTRKQLVMWSLLAGVLTYLIMSPASGRLGSTHLFWFRLFWLGGLGCIVLLFSAAPVVRWKRRIALGGFAIVLLYWGGLAVLHALALRESGNEAIAIASERGETVRELAAMPTLANPFQWRTVFKTQAAIYRFDLDLMKQEPIHPVRYDGIDPSSGWVKEATNDRRAKIFLGFARFPVARVIDPNCTAQTLVQFADLRYTEPGSQRGTFALEVPVECAAQTAETLVNER
jgi:inner membrane protein